jgi:hypothetical protein
MAHGMLAAAIVALGFVAMGCATQAGVSDAFNNAGGSAVEQIPGDTGGASGASNAGAAGSNDNGGAAGAPQNNPGGAPGVGGGTSSTPIVPQSCTQTNQTTGCCSTASDLYYCTNESSSPTHESCSGGQVCGWDATQQYYGCVTPPVTSDPNGTFPMACAP